MGIAQQLWSQRNAVIQTHTQRSFHASTAGMRFFFRHRCQECQAHLGVITQREYAFRLKEDTNRGFQSCQISNNANTVCNITGKARYVFADNHVQFTCLGIRNHSVELVSFPQRCAADSLIRVNIHKCPVRMLNNKVLIVLLLEFVGSSLFHIVSRYTNIDSDSLMDVIVVVVRLLFLRDILIVFRIDFNIHPSPLLLYALLFLLSFPYINHP